LFSKPANREPDYLCHCVRKSFRESGSEEYYNTLFHELTHSTGHTSRLDREGINQLHFFGDPVGCDAEEVVAQSSISLLNGLNLTNQFLVLRILGVNRLHGLLEGSLLGFYDNRALSDKFVHGFLNQLVPEFPLLGH